MRYPHILAAAAFEPWLIEEHKLRAITQLLLFQASGGKYSQEEIEMRIPNSQAQAVARAEGNIGIINVYGVIAQRMNMMMEFSGGTSTDALGVKFRAMLSDDSIKAIILNMDTPGGSVSGVPELAQEIFDSRGKKPIIAQINSLSASGGYYIAVAADEIVSTPSGRGGSIGVYTIHEDMTNFFEQEGIKHTIIRAGENKIRNNPYEPLSDDLKEELQQSVDRIKENFVDFVAQGRNKSKKYVLDNFGDGKVFDAPQMLEKGMIDRISTLTQTMERYGLSVHPIATQNRKNRVESGSAFAVLQARARGGERPTVREWEKSLKDMGFSQSEAERAVRLWFKDAERESQVTESATENDGGSVQLETLKTEMNSLSTFLKLK